MYVNQELIGNGKDQRSEIVTTKYEKKKSTVQHPIQMSVDETNALKNWQQRMHERKRQQGYISSKHSQVTRSMHMLCGSWKDVYSRL